MVELYTSLIEGLQQGRFTFTAHIGHCPLARAALPKLGENKPSPPSPQEVRRPLTTLQHKQITEYHFNLQTIKQKKYFIDIISVNIAVIPTSHFQLLL
jgi:hypothetical protein